MHFFSIKLNKAKLAIIFLGGLFGLQGMIFAPPSRGRLTDPLASRHYRDDYYNDRYSNSPTEVLMARVAEQENMERQAVKVSKRQSALHDLQQAFEANTTGKSDFTALDQALNRLLAGAGTPAAEVVDGDRVLHPLEVYVPKLKSWIREYRQQIAAKQITFPQARDAFKKRLDREESGVTGSLRELESYNSFSNSILRAFVPDFVGGSVVGIPQKVLLAMGIPVAEAFRNSLDSELEKVAGGLIKRMFRQMRLVAVSLGWASPLPVQKVESWIKFVKNYQGAMEKLGTGSAHDGQVAKVFDIRSANRPDKQGAFGEVDASEKETSADAQTVEIVKPEVSVPVDEYTRFMKAALPTYVRVSDSFVKQLTNQVALVKQDMANHYDEQREILTDILEMLKGVGFMVSGAHKEYRQPALAPQVATDLHACCASILSQLTLLKDMINVDGEKSDDDKDPFGHMDRKGMGRLR